jgi:signal transduction histidine kinase
LQNPELSEKEQTEYARAITEHTRKLSALITNILKLNRLENQQIFPEKQDYNLSEQICECLLGFEQAWEKKNLEIETEIDEEVIVCQDAELLSLVWNNLFSNAIKFCKEEGTVSVSVKKEKDGVLVSVSDEGCGISPEVGVHIFEKFYQGDTSHATQGNGLGLALVKRVIDIVGGEIHVQSVLGKGSTFLVRLGECE